MTSGSIPLENPVRLAPVDTARKLHIGHFAFMRALIQGTDTKAAWERYLQIEGEHSDVRTARRTIAWIRDAFAAAARREHRFGTARLVLVDVAKLGEREPHQPTLDQFVADRGLEGFLESEQIVAFFEEYPAIGVQQKRRAKLIAKQLEALRWLEELAAQPPAAGDPIISWLHPDLAGHLQAGKLFTLRQLVNHINGIGRRWYAPIPAIGPLKAKHIEDWLRAHELSIGMTLGGHVMVARKRLYTHELVRVLPRQTGIVPIDKLIVPSELDGSQGTFRAAREHCMMRASNDHEAVLLWIKTRHGMSPEQKRVVHVGKKLYWMHSASTDDAVRYQVHERRGREALLAFNLLPRFKGVAVHDGSPAYDSFSVTHALCNAHHLRELEFVVDSTGQQWAQDMIDLLVQMNDAVNASADAVLSEEVASAYRKRYRRLIAQGYAINPEILTDPTRKDKRGGIKQTFPRNLLRRLDQRADDVLRFMTNAL